jgi:hypothetical protein
MFVYFDLVLSPCYGKVEKVSISNDTIISELEPLFLIKTEEGYFETIYISENRKVESLEVQEGDDVIPGMVLAFLKENKFVIRSD